MVTEINFDSHYAEHHVLSNYYSFLMLLDIAYDIMHMQLLNLESTQ